MSVHTPTTEFPPITAAGASVHEIFKHTAQTYPGKVAVTTDAESVTYRDLDERADACAARLRAAGIGAEDRVGLYVERSAGQIAWILGILKAGAAYVPVDTRTPPRRAESVFAAASCAAVVSDQPLSTAVPVLPPHGAAASRPERAAAWEPAGVGEPDALAYVLFTSGSTGAPKGVMVTHRNITALFAGAAAAGLTAGHDDVWSYFHSVAFDFSVWEIWGALLHGGRLVVIPHHVARSPERFLDLVVEEGVTILSQTPTAHRLLDREASKRGHPQLPLRRVVFGGEALQVTHLRRWIDAYGDTRPELINMYGITETTVHVTVRRITRRDVEEDSGTSPIGGPLPHARVRIVDPDSGTALADGAVGELVVSGSGISRGYFGSPALTAERFVPDPDGESGSRCYRSGDLGWFSAVGLHYAGRHDRQLKLRGFRIEPGEIEAAVRGLPGVSDAVVLLRDRDAGAFLVAFAVVDAPDEHNPGAARQALSAVLPPYEVPALCVFVPALPMTANGKLDEKALLAEYERRADELAPHAAEAPEDGTADEGSQLLAIMRRHLPVSVFGAEDDFFASGGDSITAVQVVAEAAEAGIGISVLDLLHRPSVRALLDAPGGERPGAAVAAGPQPQPGTSAAFALCRDADRRRMPDGVVDAVPLTSQQLGIVHTCELAESPELYHDMTSVQIEGPCDRESLHRALVAVQARHAVLRSSLDIGHFSEALRLVWAQVPVAVEWATAAGGSRAELSALAGAWWTRQRSRPVDLSRPPALRYHVACAPDAFRLSLGTHHAFVDGWSFARLVTDLLLCYEGARRGAAVELPPLPADADTTHVTLERKAVARPEYADFWQEETDVPALFPRPGRHLPPVARSLRFLPLSMAQVQDLRAAARASGVPLKSLTLAAHVRALARATGQTGDIVTGLVVNGRPEMANADLLVGMYLKTVPLRISTDGPDLAITARDAFAAERRAHKHRHYPLALIDARLRRPSFDVSFNFTDFHVLRALDALRDVRPSGWTYSDTASFLFLVEFMAGSPDSEPGLNLHFDPSLLPPGVVDRYAEAVRAELAEAARR